MQKQTDELEAIKTFLSRHGWVVATYIAMSWIAGLAAGMMAEQGRLHLLGSLAVYVAWMMLSIFMTMWVFQRGFNAANEGGDSKDV